ncbi:unnamed protein product [Cyprideis torosa]|uniref:Uncharacterized protein n=1 Tax=Cyprideis torosa TaxID=163714 RepID=A0A7R8W767_9CRUS|nr:unnamed protein product [Cyprideis torosa]CAG0887251.1 unnamed protein product [Cyprideis torosa]
MDTSEETGAGSSLEKPLRTKKPKQCLNQRCPGTSNRFHRTDDMDKLTLKIDPEKNKRKFLCSDCHKETRALGVPYIERIMSVLQARPIPDDDDSDEVEVIDDSRVLRPRLVKPRKKASIHPNPELEKAVQAGDGVPVEEPVKSVRRPLPVLRPGLINNPNPPDPLKPGPSVTRSIAKKSTGGSATKKVPSKEIEEKVIHPDGRVVITGIEFMGTLDTPRDVSRCVKQHEDLTKLLEDNNEKIMYIMDAKVKGNIGRYLNQSCDPNVFVQNVFVDSHELRFPWVAFFASENIKACEELIWNFAYVVVDSVAGKCVDCHCNTKLCRGRML